MRRPTPRQRPLRLSRLSLWYPAIYLMLMGTALFAAPDWTLQLLRSTGDYGMVFPRAGGLLLIGLDVVVVQIIRHKVEVLYATTVGVWILFLAGLLWCFWLSRDPFFAIVFGAVGTSALFTSVALAVDWHRRR